VRAVNQSERGRVLAKVLMRKRQAAISGRGRTLRKVDQNVDFSPNRTCVSPGTVTQRRVFV